MSFYLFFK